MEEVEVVRAVAKGKAGGTDMVTLIVREMEEEDEVGSMEGKNPVVSLWMDLSRCLIMPPVLTLVTRHVRTPLRFSASVDEAISEMIVTVTVMMTTTGMTLMLMAMRVMMKM